MFRRKFLWVRFVVGVFASGSLAGCVSASPGARMQALDHVRKQNDHNARFAQWQEAERAFEFNLTNEQLGLGRQMVDFQNRESAIAFVDSLQPNQQTALLVLLQEYQILQQEAEQLLAEKPKVLGGLLEEQQQEEYQRRTLGLLLLGLSNGLASYGKSLQEIQQNQMLWNQQEQTRQLQQMNQQLQHMQMNQQLQNYGIPAW